MYSTIQSSIRKKNVNLRKKQKSLGKRLFKESATNNAKTPIYSTSGEL